MAATDGFSTLSPGLSSPATNAAVVTTNDSTDLGNVTRALYIGGAGNITVNMLGTGTNLTLNNVTAGTLLPIRVSRVWANGTTASSIVALW